MRGAAASPGRVDGPVAVIRDAAQAAGVPPGRVLVCGPTTPQFMPAVVGCAGIVSADMGLLCHTAIVARELGKPCVVGLHHALDQLADGTLVTVDVRVNRVG